MLEEEAEKDQSETLRCGRAASKGNVTEGCATDGGGGVEQGCSDCSLSPLGTEEAKLAKSHPPKSLLFTMYPPHEAII